MIVNYDSFIQFMTIVVTVLLLIDVLYRLTKESLEPKDKYTKVRWLLVFLTTVFLITMIPVGYYSITRALGTELSEFFKSILRITGKVGPLAIAIALDIICRQKISKD